jgi:solute carrier family 35 protein E1
VCAALTSNAYGGLAHANSACLTHLCRAHGLKNPRSYSLAVAAMASASPVDPPPHATFKFPAFQPDLLPTHEEEPFGVSSSRTPSPNPPTEQNGSALLGKWQPRKDMKYGRMNGAAQTPSSRHGRQKSLSEAFRTIRTRKASVSQNAHELADALKAPVSPRLIVCGHMYVSRKQC